MLLEILLFCLYCSFDHYHFQILWLDISPVDLLHQCDDNTRLKTNQAPSVYNKDSDITQDRSAHFSFADSSRLFVMLSILFLVCCVYDLIVYFKLFPFAPFYLHVVFAWLFCDLILAICPAVLWFDSHSLKSWWMDLSFDCHVTYTKQHVE